MNPSGAAAPTAGEAIEQLETLITYTPPQRNDAWRMTFFENLRVAGPYALRLISAEDSPNGFPYHALVVAEIRGANATLSFEDVLDEALSAGAGLAIYAENGSPHPEFLASFGDLVGVRAWGHLIMTRAQSSVEIPSSNTPVEFEVANPLEAGFPEYALRHTLAYMRARLSIDRPRLLAARRRGWLGWDLVADLDPESFSDEAFFLEALSSIKWFVPAETAVMANPFGGDTALPWFSCT
ncbi:hypothetical protein EPN52_02340 [bacterium]|nr:MAG: hypothetical protein EPN52_02340 [bacterium]